MKALAPRLIATVLVAVTAMLAAGPTASATPSAAAATARQPAIGNARVVKRGKWQSRRTLQRRRQAAARARTAREARASREAKAEATPAGNPEILFDGDFDNGFGGWHVQSLSGRASLVGDAFQGNQAARFEVQAGDVEPETGSQRSEVSGPTFDEGEDLYIRDAIRIPDGNSYSAPWQIVEQLHEANWSGSPGLALFLDDQHTLWLGSGDGRRLFWGGPELQTDRWYDLVYRVNLSQDPGAGFVEVWLDGVPQTLVSGQARAYGQTMQAPQTYLKAGIYRSPSSTGTSVVEHDAIAVGTSFAAVSGA